MRSASPNPRFTSCGRNRNEGYVLSSSRTTTSNTSGNGPSPTITTSAGGNVC